MRYAAVGHLYRIFGGLLITLPLTGMETPKHPDTTWSNCQPKIYFSNKVIPESVATYNHHSALFPCSASSPNQSSLPIGAYAIAPLGKAPSVDDFRVNTWPCDSAYPAMLSPNGNGLLALSEDEKSLTLYSVLKKECIATFAPHSGYTHMCFSDTYLFIRTQKALQRYCSKDNTTKTVYTLPEDESFPYISQAPALIALSDSLICVLEAGKKLSFFIEAHHTPEWQRVSIFLPCATSLYALQGRLGKTILACNKNSWHSPEESRHLIISTDQRAIVGQFSHKSSGNGVFSPCEKFVALEDYGSEKVSLFSIEDPKNIQKIYTIGSVSRIIGWLAITGHPLICAGKYEQKEGIKMIFPNEHAAAIGIIKKTNAPLLQ